MKCTRLLFVLVLLLQSLFSQANPTASAPYSCNLPAPAWIKAVEITSSRIKIQWASVSGAVKYKVTRYDVTHNVQLPDAYPLEEEYTSEPHDPATTIAFQIYPVCSNEQVSESSTGAEYVTSWIIVDDITLFTIPGSTQGNYPIAPGAEATLGFTNADKNSDTVVVQRFKAKYTDKGIPYYAEFLLWSHCSASNNTGARVKYWASSPGVTHTENHVNGPDSPISSITFNLPNNGAFFTLLKATFIPGNEGPNMGDIKMRNDRFLPSQNIIFEKGKSYETNPCYAPPGFAVDGGQYSPTEAVSDDAKAQDRTEFLALEMPPGLKITPNPFSENVTVHYILNQESPVTLTLFDHTGRQLKTMELPTLVAGDYNTGIYTNDLPAGIYLLAFQTNQSRQVTTLVKHN